MTALPANPLSLETIFTANEELLHLTIRHAVLLRGLDKSTEKALIDFLRNSVYPDITAKLNRELAMVNFGGGVVHARSAARFRRMQMDIRELVRAGMRDARAQLASKMFDLSKAEAQWQLGAFAKANPITLSYSLPAASTLRAIVNSDKIQGRTLTNWFAGISRDTWGNIERQVNIGIVQGESITGIMRRIQGTRSLGFRDGV